MSARTSVMNGRRPAASSDSHHCKNSGNFLFQICISNWSWPKGRGSPDSRYGLMREVSVSNSQPSMSILRISMWVCSMRSCQNRYKISTATTYCSSSWGYRECTSGGLLHACRRLRGRRGRSACGEKNFPGSVGRRIWRWNHSPKLHKTRCFPISRLRRKTRSWYLGFVMSTR